MGTEARRTPAVDILESAESWTVVADLPGCAREDVELTVLSGRLTIEARPQRPEMPVSAAAQRREAAALPFRRVVALDPALEVDKATATVDRGVLYVKVPFRREGRETKIPVS
jgi:HSP20 family protein